MSDSGEDDLPVLSIGGEVTDSRPYAITKIDVDEEIAQSLARKVRIQKIKNEQVEYEKNDLLVLPQVPELNEPKIRNFPPERPFFKIDLSLKSFNSGSLTIQNLCSSDHKILSEENIEEYFYWFRSKFKCSSNDLKRNLLQYVWLLLSCHPNPYVVQKCYDTLLEYNSCWRLKYEEVLLVFFNWGVSIEDFVTDLNLHEIKASLDSSPVVSSLNVENVSSSGTNSLIGDFNVEKVLQILNCQLSICDLDGSETCRKPVFILLTLLTLDKDYYFCLSEVEVALVKVAIYASTKSEDWVAEYVEELFKVENHHSRLAFLAECILPERMRWCFCLCYCQKVFSLQPTFVVAPELDLLTNVLLNHMDDLLKLESCELYSLFSVVDAGISKVMSYESKDATKEDFLGWLNDFMERKRERVKEEIDVDATLIAELVSRLQAEWEASWLEQPQARIVDASEEMDIQSDDDDE